MILLEKTTMALLLGLLVPACTGPSTDTSHDTGLDPKEAPEPPWLGFCDAWDSNTLGGGLADLQPLDPQVGYFADLGMPLARPHRPGGHVFALSVIHPNPHTWDFSLADHIVEAAQDAGARLLVTLQLDACMDTPSCFAATNIPPERLGEWSDFVKTVVERYDGDGVEDMPGLEVPVYAWEVGNEPHCGSEDTACMQIFVDTVRVTWKSAHHAHADALVVAGGSAPLYHPEHDELDLDELALWTWFFEHGGADWTDAFSYHMATGTASRSVSEYEAAWDEIVPADLPRWLTESGPYGVGEQASHEDPTEAALWYASELEAAQAEGIERAMFCLARTPLRDHPKLAEVLEDLSKTGDPTS